MRTSATVLLAGVLVATCASAAGAGLASRATRHEVVLTHQPQLFLDDDVIGSTVNLKRAMRVAVRYEHNPVLPVDRPWEAAGVTHPCVLYDSEAKLFRMYYTAYATRAGASGAGALACYAESTDGFTWRKPELDIQPFGDSATSNILFGSEPEVLFLHVTMTPHDPDRMFKAVFTRRNPPGQRGVGGLFTTFCTDGIHWTKPRCISRTKCDTMPSVVWYPPVGRYLIYTRAQAAHPQIPGHMRMTGILESTDFERWTAKQAVNLLTEADGWPRAQVHDIQAHVYGDVLLGLVGMLHLPQGAKTGSNKGARWDVELATSRDGWRWQRIGHGGFFGRSLAVRGDTFYLYHDDKAGTLAADRLVALQLVDGRRQGILDTRPVRFAGRELLVNGDVEAGDLKVELIDEKGPHVQFQSKPLRGFERDRSRLIRHDKLRWRVRWKADGKPRSLADASPHQPFVLRFILNRGSLFAFQVLE